ncbi:MAG: glycoside hydrolase family 95 protein [Chitinophagaceae bacterium]|nr:glycoside hydrolase family 95 protein [Chitinophagaceae bacterium]
MSDKRIFILSYSFKLYFPFILLLVSFCTADAQESEIGKTIQAKSFNPSTLLWYKSSAAKWEDALPVGNGRLGAMIFGRNNEEQIQLNEDTYWSGGPYSTVVKGGYKSLPEIQQLIFKGEYLKAHNLYGRTLMGYPVEQQKYQSLGNLHLFFTNEKEIAAYYRWLDLNTGISSVQYVSDGVTYRRDIFSSAADQVIAIRLSADQPGKISFSANLRGVRNQAHSNYATDYFQMNGNAKGELVLTGKSADYMGVEGKLRYEARVKAITEGGTVSVNDYTLIVENATAVTLYIVAATNFVNYKDVSADAHQRVEEYLAAIANKSYDVIRERHISDYQRLFNRLSFSLPVTENSYLPTNERKENNTTISDPSLAALAYQFGRYILISSSRPGTQPANLQGIWNDNQNPMWDSKYTTNINTEMNYWMAESSNLAECAEPLIKMVTELTDQGSQVAKEHYGCNGWVFHQNTDLWRVAAPMDGPTWGTFTTGGAWLCTHLWEHFLYTRDTQYLREIYPVIKGAVQFFSEFLIKHPNGKWLVTNPSTSPENFPASPGNGKYFDEVTGSFLPGTSICAGSSIDMQLLNDLFSYYIRATEIMNMDKDFAEKIKEIRQQLVPPQIAKDGTLQEWMDDWAQTEHPHRHISHLYGLYPGNIFSVKRTPQWINACRNTLIERGDESSSWSRAWKAALWTRLRDGNHAYKIMKGYFKETSNPQFFANKGFPIQVDGTLGIPAAISEMIVQSQEGVIELLPALPDEWHEGTINGLRARGAFELNVHWQKKKVKNVTITSIKGEPCNIRPGIKCEIRNSSGKKVKIKIQKDGTISFPTAAGETYLLTAL